MNRRLRPAFALVFLATLVACGSVPKVISRHAEFGNVETYIAGETRTYPDGLEVTLDRVDDSRCKPDVQCIWAGELAPQLTLRGGALAGASTVALGTTRNQHAQVGAYALTLDSATERSARIIVTR